MVLVTARAWLSLLVIAAPALLGCKRAGSPRPDPTAGSGGTAAPSGRALTSSSARPGPSGGPAAPASSGEAPATPSVSVAPRPWPLASDCRDPRVLLAVRSPSDLSRHLWLKQILTVFPELQLQTGQARGPQAALSSGQLALYETAYGPKRFAQPRPFEQPDFYQVGLIARCGDLRTCEALAAIYAAVDPRASVQFFCGVPPATSGGEGVVPLLQPGASIPTELAALEEASCARIRSCQARLAHPRSQCAAYSVAELKRCAAEASCGEALRCAEALVSGELRPEPNRTARPRSPTARPPIAPGTTRDDLF